MKCLMEVATTEKFSFDGKSYVKIQGFAQMDGWDKKKLMETTVREELVPDSLEGKTCLLEFEIGLSKFKPFLRLKNIVLD